MSDDRQDQAPAIEVTRLCKNYGKIRAIHDVSFTVEPGQIVGFLGPNGAGKSTTMRILAGLQTATAGVARICGIPIANRAHEVKPRIGYMPEHNPLPEDMRVLEYLRHRARLKEVPSRKLKGAVDEAMEICDLQKKARRRLIGGLSKGYRQRVGIADAILATPEVIIMDEPTIGLDPHQILSIRKLIDSLRGRMTVILSSHILPEIERCCDRVIIINQGRIVTGGTPRELRREFLRLGHYRLTTNAPRDELRALLRSFPAPFAVDGEEAAEPDGFTRYELSAPLEEPLGETLLEACREAGWRVAECAEIEPTLEDIFIVATRRAWQDTSTPFGLVNT